MSGERPNEALAAPSGEEDEREDLPAEVPAEVASVGNLPGDASGTSLAANDAVSEGDGAASAVMRTVPPLTASIVPAADTTRVGVVQGSRRWVFIAKHYAWTSVRSKRWWFLAALTLVQVALIAWPLLRLNVGFWAFIGSFAGLLGTNILKRWKENQPRERHIVARNYDERKLALYKLIHAMQERHLMTPPQVEDYQRDVLALIASYVRDHRCDWGVPTIFANLLVEEGADLVVVARDQDHRNGRARYPKQRMLAATALASGIPKLTGDICRDYPDTSPEKPYSSVLAIPIHRDGEVVGVISIDSSQKFHFDLEGSKLVDYLRPYIALLSWTLPKRPKPLYLPPGVTK